MICKCCLRFSSTGRFWYDDTDFNMYMYGGYPEDIQFVCLYCDYQCLGDECLRPPTINRDGSCPHTFFDTIKLDNEEKYCINCGELEKDLNTRTSHNNMRLGFS